MGLKTFLQILSRRRWIVVVTLAVALGLTALATALTPKSYTSTTTLRLATAVSGSLDSVNYQLNYADRLMNTYAGIATSRPVLDEVARATGLEELSGAGVSVNIPADTELLKISVKSSTPESAARIANQVAVELIKQSGELSAGNTSATIDLLEGQLSTSELGLIDARNDYESLLAQFPEDSQRVRDSLALLESNQASYTRLASQLNEARSRLAVQSANLSVIEPAVPPLKQAEPRAILNMVLALIAGTAAGMGLAVLVDGLDSSVSKVQDIESLTDAPVMGLIPLYRPGRLRFRRRPAPGFVLSENYPNEDAFRRLRIAVGAAASEPHVRVIVVASAEDGEGKSTIVAKLSQSYAKLGLGVVVVDANTRSSSLEELYGISVITPVNSVEQGFDGRNSATPSTIQGVDVVTVGASVLQEDLLGSRSIKIIVKELADQYDAVLIDTPGLLSRADAAVVAPLADGVLFAVKLGQTKLQSAEAGLRQLTAVKANLVGVVVNGAKLS